jgi:hypothetical protein
MENLLRAAHSAIQRHKCKHYVVHKSMGVLLQCLLYAFYLATILYVFNCVIWVCTSWSREYSHTARINPCSSTCVFRAYSPILIEWSKQESFPGQKTTPMDKAAIPHVLPIIATLAALPSQWNSGGGKGFAASALCDLTTTTTILESISRRSISKQLRNAYQATVLHTT